MSEQKTGLSHPYYKRLLIFSGVFLMILVAISLLTPVKWFSAYWPFIFTYLLVTTAITHYFISKDTEDKPQKYIRRYMISILFKLTSHMVIIAIYIFLNKSDAIGFIIAFFLMYLGFTLFENQYIFKESKKK